MDKNNSTAVNVGLAVELHSPGPWFVNSQKYGSGIRRWISPMPGGVPGVAIAFINGDHHGEINDANAALIAASPELLAACEAFVQAEASDHPDDYAKAVRLAVPTIAKAKAKDNLVNPKQRGRHG